MPKGSVVASPCCICNTVLAAMNTNQPCKWMERETFDNKHIEPAIRYAQWDCFKLGESHIIAEYIRQE